VAELNWQLATRPWQSRLNVWPYVTNGSSHANGEVMLRQWITSPPKRVFVTVHRVPCLDRGEKPHERESVIVTRELPENSDAPLSPL
jgi:hypothetical protein